VRFTECDRRNGRKRMLLAIVGSGGRSVCI
jgi:hypothetical protein